MSESSDLAHFAWCALVALQLARQEGKAQSALTTHTFLLGWMAAARKQKRFSRTVSFRIDSLLHLSRQKGPGVGLFQKLKTLWQAGEDFRVKQSDLFRLATAIETLKSCGWVNAVVSDDEWHPQQLQEDYAGVSALLVRRSELERQFSEDGQLQGKVSFLVAGDVAAVSGVFHKQALLHLSEVTSSGMTILVLLHKRN
ncbi:DUF2913 family protein [Mangrovibacter sp. SLW1]